MNQLTLDLAAPRTPGRNKPAIERLRAVLKRKSINPGYRESTGNVLLRPFLAARSGYQCLCSYYCCGDLTWERVDYCDREPLKGAERLEWAKWRESIYRPAVHELWGAP